MDRWRTVSKSDPDFARLLDGTFSADLRAIPRRSLNVGGAAEEVTFEIVPASEVESPHPLAIALHALRPETLILSLGPMAAAVAWTRWSRSALDFPFAALSFAGVLAFHASLNLLNDYVDHVGGADRVNAFGGSRAIQRGWARAVAFRRWGAALFALALAAGLAVSARRPVALLPVGACSLGAAYFLARSSRRGPRVVGAREAATFALGGPLVASGFVAASVDGDLASAARAAFEPATLALGAAFGFSALLYVTLGHFEGLMNDSLAGTQTLAARLGFDRAKRLIAAAAAGAPACALAFAAASGAFAWLAPSAALAAGASAYAANGAISARSPLSSSLRGARNRALWVHWALAAAIVVGLLAGRYE